MRNDVTLANAVSEGEVIQKITFSALLCEQMLNEKDHQTTKQKKHSMTSPAVQLKEFSLTIQQTTHRTDYEWIGKPFLKITLKKKQNQNAASENKKSLARKVNLILTKN